MIVTMANGWKMKKTKKSKQHDAAILTYNVRIYLDLASYDFTFDCMHFSIIK